MPVPVAAVAVGAFAAFKGIPGCTHFVPIDDHEDDQPSGTRVPNANATENVPRDDDGD